MKLGLNLKLSIFVGVVVFVVAFVVGQYSSSVSTQQMKVKANEHLLTVAKNINDILDREMLERYREMKFASQSEILTSKTVAIEEKRRFIQRIKDGYNHHEWIGYALPDGTVAIGTDGYLEGKNAKARPWHPAGLKGPYIGDVHDALLLAKLLPNISGEAIYFTDVAFPVIASDGDTLGVICTHLTWQWTRDIIRSIQKEKAVDIFLVSNDGLILVGPNDSERKNIKDISSNVAEKFLDSDEKHDVIEWKNGISYLTATSVSKGMDEYKGFSWRVIIRQQSDVAFKEISQNSKNILIFSIVAGVIGALIIAVFSSWFFGPIKKLNTLVNKMKTDRNIEINKTDLNDEVGQLQNTIASLSEKLKEESSLKKDAEQKVEIALKLFDQSIEGIIVSNEDNKIILINETFSKMTGYTMEDVLNKDPNILSSGLHDQGFYDAMWNEIKKNGKWEGRLKNKKKSGLVYDEHLKITTLRNSEGKIIYYIATFMG